MSARTDTTRYKVWEWLRDNGPANGRLLALRLGVSVKTASPELTKGVTQTPPWYKEVDPPTSFPEDLPSSHRGGRWVQAIPGVGPGLLGGDPVPPSAEELTPAELRDRVAEKIATLTQPRDAQWLARELGLNPPLVNTALSVLLCEQPKRAYRGKSRTDKIRAPGSPRKTWHYLKSQRAWDQWEHGLLLEGTPSLEGGSLSAEEPSLPDSEVLDTLIADSDSRLKRMKTGLARELRQNRFLKALRAGTFSDAPQ